MEHDKPCLIGDLSELLDESEEEEEVQQQLLPAVDKNQLTDEEAQVLAGALQNIPSDEVCNKYILTTVKQLYNL